MRVSASGISRLFRGTTSTKMLDQPPENTEPNAFMKTNVLVHGNVYEHRALEIIKVHHPDTHGQSAFARMLEKHELDGELEHGPDLELSARYARNAKAGSSGVFPEYHMLVNWEAATSQLKSYEIHGVIYDVGRRTKQIGNVTLVTQPDGLCDGDKTTIEVKCPYGKMYEPNDTKFGFVKWLHYIVQVAIEMNVFGANQAMFAVYIAPKARFQTYIDRAPQAKIIMFKKAELQPLVNKLKTLIHRMGTYGSGENARQIYMSCESQVKSAFEEAAGALQAIAQRILKKEIQMVDMAIPPAAPATPVTPLPKRPRRASIRIVSFDKRPLKPNVVYKIFAEPTNTYDSGAIRVSTYEGYVNQQFDPETCYVTRASKGSWLLPLLDNIVSCKASGPDTLDITFAYADTASAAGVTPSTKRKRSNNETTQITLRF